MHFSKEQKKYFLNELKGTITNNFNFTSKSLNQVSSAIQQPPIRCAKCKLPIIASICSICKTDNQLPPETQFKQNFAFRQKMEQQAKMQQCMILLVDMSGSMVCSYKSKYQKVNEDLVRRILGQNNYNYLTKKLGKQKVLMNYSLYEMLLNQGDSAKDIVQIIKMQQGNKTSSKVQNEKQKDDKKQDKKQQQIEDYISRKEIVEITISKCLTIMKNMHPQTHVTIVYFNDNIQIPVDFFNEKLTIAGIETKNVEQMIQLGVDYSSKISKAKASNIGQNLIMNLTKTQQCGTTALGPALAFCFGLAKAFKYSLNQIVVVTDGVSNVGFGQTDNELQHEMGKKFYQQLALQYAKPLNCVVDVIAFQDQCIGYDVVDQLVDITGGIPCQIQFTKLGGVNIVTQETFSNIAFKLSTAFTQYISKLNYQTKTIITCLNQNVKLKVQNQLTPFIQSDKGNTLILNTGIKSSDYAYIVEFSIPPQLEQIGNNIKFLIINEYKKKNKKYMIVFVQKIKIVKGTKQQAQKQQAVTLQKQIKNALRPRQLFEQDINQYKKISMKIEDYKNVENNLDQQLVEKFKMKKEKLEEDMKNFDKFTRQKLSMRSRAQKTFKRNDPGDDDDDWK